MSDSLAAEQRRLALAAAMTAQAARLAGDAEPVDAVRPLADASHRDTRFKPPFPGVRVREGEGQLVLACTAFREGVELGTVFTTLISGRKPRVSVAPPGTPYGH